MCQNIDDFNRGCALIMARLYRSFPTPVHLDVSALDAGEDLFADDRAKRLDERSKIYVATLQLLDEEGFVTYRDFDDWHGFAGVRLTSKGLAALNRVPDALKPPQKTLGDRLLGITGELAGAAGKEALKVAVQAMLA